MSIRAVLFDLDNTLTHRGRSVAAFSQSLADTYQSQLNCVDVEQIESIVNRIDHGGYPLPQYLTHPTIATSVAHALLKELNWYSPPTPEDLNCFWLKAFGKSAVAMPEAEQILVRLKRAGYKLAIVSNDSHDTRLSILKGLGFQHYFDVIHSSGQLGHAKPHKEIFVATARQLLVQVEQCLFIGDHPVNDVQGAQQAGMQALWLSGFHVPLVQMTAPSITTLSEIFDYLEC